MDKDLINFLNKKKTKEKVSEIVSNFPINDKLEEGPNDILKYNTLVDNIKTKLSSPEKYFQSISDVRSKEGIEKAVELLEKRANVENTLSSDEIGALELEKFFFSEFCKNESRIDLSETDIFILQEEGDMENSKKKIIEKLKLFDKDNKRRPDELRKKTSIKTRP